jgi:hypothetical protein
MRIWLSGPRLFRGLVRPGISFSLNELQRRKTSRRREVSKVSRLSGHFDSDPPSGKFAPRPDSDPPASPDDSNHLDSPDWIPVPQVEPLSVQLIAFVVAALAIFGAVALIAVLVMPAHAGTCVIHGDGSYTIESCENGSFTVWDSHGHKTQWGQPNAGFERYPDQPKPPVYPRRD